MKKLIIYFNLMLLVIGSIVGCATNDASGYYSGISEEERLEGIKQDFLHFGEEYGIPNIVFNDDLLKRNLNLTKNEIEKIVIAMAMKNNSNMSTGMLRKKIRTRGIGDSEEGDQPFFHHIDGDIARTAIKDSFEMPYTLSYYIVSSGAAFIGAFASTCNIKRNGHVVKSFPVGNVALNYSIPIVDFQGGVGEYAYVTLNHQLTIRVSDSTIVNFPGNQTYMNVTFSELASFSSIIKDGL